MSSGSLEGAGLPPPPPSSATEIPPPGQPQTHHQGADTGEDTEIFIEADSRNADSTDSDSTLGDDTASSTASLQSAVTNYIQENGRTYHASRPNQGGAYFLPNDEEELDRLDLFHHCLVLRTEGKLHHAPLSSDIQKVLDLGTGTGIWAIEMGDLYPSAAVLGNDLSPTQPNMVPPNVSFEVDNIELDWIYTSDFDYIHGRYLAGAIKDWPRLIQQAYKFTKPGGWVEFQDFDMIFYTNNGKYEVDCPADQWAKHIVEGITMFGLEPSPGHQLEGWMKAAGFVNIVAVKLPIPLGPWAKDKTLKQVGSFDLLSFLDGLEAISIRVFTAAHKWQPDEVKVFLATVRKDMLNFKLQIQHDYYIVYGQRPPEPEAVE